MRIIFAGIKGRVIQSSPHGNYLVVELSDRITITGTYSNQFNWEESPDIASGFTSFIAYIGLKYSSEMLELRKWISDRGGYFLRGEDSPRKSKRVTKFPLEIKVRGLTPESVIELCRREVICKDAIAKRE